MTGLFPEEHHFTPSRGLQPADGFWYPHCAGVSMALRILEAIVPSHCADRLLEKLGSDQFPQVIEQWSYSTSCDRTCVRAVLDAEATESLTDSITALCSGEEFRLTLQPIEAIIPQPEETQSPAAEQDGAEKAPLLGRLSREELLDDVEGSARLTALFLIMSTLSALVAVIGLTRDSVAIIIGAMVIAPFLGPNVGLSLATALADVRLAVRSLRSLAAGFGLALVVALVAGLILRPSPDTPEIAARTAAGWGDIVLAVVAGIAAGFTYTTGISNALVGVMVAVALLPVWVTFGILLGAGHIEPALGALLLTAINLICLNLTGVATFAIQGISPARWWEAKKAKRMTLLAIVAWGSLLAILVVLSYFARFGGS